MGVLDDGQLLGPGALAARIGPYGASGKTLSPETVARWIGHGVACPGGRVVRLEAVRVGNRLLTSWEAFKRFVAAQQPDAPPAADAPAG